MRVDTLVTVPCFLLAILAAKNIYTQFADAGADTTIDCALRPFSYSVAGAQRRCAWEPTAAVIAGAVLAGAVVLVVAEYLVTAAVRFFTIATGAGLLGVAGWMYMKAYRAHAYCQSFILPVMKATRKRVRCEDDAFYIEAGVIFLVGLLVIFHGLCYVISDRGIRMGDLDFSTSLKDQSTDEYARDVRHREERVKAE